MAKDLRTFTKGKMNKELDERLVPDGEYTDALNIRVGSTEEDEMGVIETTLGNTQITTLEVQNTPLSSNAACIGALEDGSTETIYWFVHDPSFPASSNTNKLDLIVSFNTTTEAVIYHVISMDDGGGVNTTLNFNPQYLITGVSLIDDLLFFTDDINPPRRINIDRSYGEPTAGDVDTIVADELLVVKKAPVTSPLVQSTFNDGLSSTFLEVRFICFAYRWRYDDNEYSATSQFSKPAFTPKDFDFNPKSYLNEGFINKDNNAIITFNTGSNLVKGIDLLFKEANDSTIKVIEKLDKETLGLPDNNDITFNFNDSKIFTILPSSEILRLYDNVPLLAQAQTLMGNRLMYGNYLEGYNLVDTNGNPTQLNYICTLRSNDLTEETLPNANIVTSSTTYTLAQSVIGGASASVDGKNTIDLTPFCVDANGNSRLTAGSIMQFEFQVYIDSAATQEVGGGPFPTQVPEGTATEPQTFIVSFVLDTNYDSLADWMGSTGFINRVGTLSNILPVFDSGGASTSCNGATVTDSYNCGRDQSLGTFTLVTTGITSATTIAQPEPFIFRHTTGNSCEVILPALRYVNDPASPISNSFFFYRFKVSATDVSFFPLGNSESLHSNRGYEVGIVYMDEYNRSTTALVSTSNSVHVPCSASDTKNKIRVEIPTSQVPPAFAKRYKFAIKPDASGYETIYSNIFFVDSVQNLAYILLQGENARKVDEGDRLIVKSDTSGAVNSCTYITVLEKKVLQASELPGGNGVTGTYMIVSTDGLSLSPSEGTFKNTGLVKAEAEDTLNLGDSRFPYIFLPMNDPMGNKSGGDLGPGVDYTVPIGSIIKIHLQGERRGAGNRCEKRKIVINRQYVANQNYTSLAEWFEDTGAINTLISTSYYEGDGDPNEGLVKNGGVFTLSSPTDPSIIGAQTAPQDFKKGNGKDGVRQFDFSTIGVPPGNSQGEFGATVLTYPSGRTYLGFRGTQACGANNKRKSTLQGRISVQRAIDLLVFETLPKDAQPDIFFESSVSYPITNGFHEGNVQNQTAVQSAIIDTAFYNCYAYGNGVESYKIRDSIIGKDFTLGNRVTATQGQDYKQIRRYADITYSGVYNQESNVNKTNEFNLGILNFKPLEQRFGFIRKMAGRETDILVLQEDKISYVLSGKNLLTDAVGGGDVTSVPEVLGTQIARTEEYGISNNPESYAEYGYDKFFTDAKRGVVIQLRGSSSQNEQLNVISDQGMSTWFRELFQVSFDRQKLGAYDPYAGEYVLSSNLRALPAEDRIFPCGLSTTLFLEPPITYTATFDVGTVIGNLDLFYNVPSGSSFDYIKFVYDGVDYTTGPITGPTSGFVNIPKPNPIPTTGILEAAGKGSVTVNLRCPDTIPTNVIQVCLTNKKVFDTSIHNEFSFSQVGYTSPVSSTEVTFSSSGIAPVVSQFDTFSGVQGEGFLPTLGSSVTMAANKIGTDNYVTKPTDRFSFLRTNTTYNNTPTDIANLLAAIAAAAPASGGQVGTVPLAGAGSVYTSGSFTYDSGVSALNTYLVYDYRDRGSGGAGITLCYDATDPALACCCSTSSAVYYIDASTFLLASTIYTDAALTVPAPTGYYSFNGFSRYQVTTGVVATLSPASKCGSCNPNGGTEVRGLSVDKGYYKATYNLGSGTGAVIIELSSADIPYAARIVYNGVVTNKFSSINHGLLQSGNASGYTLMGKTVSTCSNAIGTNDLTNYKAFIDGWQELDTSPTSITLDAADNKTTATETSKIVAVINKSAATPSSIDVEIPVVCGGHALNLTVNAPVTLTSTAISTVQVSDVAACAQTLTTVGYFVHAAATIGGAPQLHDLAFADSAAATPLADGFYKFDDGTASGGNIEVTNGVVTALVTCP